MQLHTYAVLYFIKWLDTFVSKVVSECTPEIRKTTSDIGHLFTMGK